MKISVMDKKDSAIAISLAKFKELKDNLLITELDDVMRLCVEALAQPAQEPVISNEQYQDLLYEYCKLKASPKQWVGLSDDDFKDTSWFTDEFIEGANWAQNKLKELNHG